MNNEFIKINEASDKEFNNYINLINTDVKNKKIFYYFLYNDLILDNYDNNIDIKDSIDNCSDIINDYFKNILNTNNYITELKKKISNKKVEIENKLKECKKDMNLLKNEFININISKYLPLNNSKTKLIFEKKTVITLYKIKKYTLEMGEFFARYIFNSIKVKNSNSNNLFNKLSKDFYDESNINTYLNNEKTDINNFNDISNNFKYWIVLLMLIYSLFNNNSNFEEILTRKELIDKTIKTLLKPQVEMKKNKKNKKKNKKGGGNNENDVKNKIESVIKEKFTKDSRDSKNTKIMKNNDKKKELITRYNTIFSSCYVDERNLSKIYIESFNKNMKEYFKNELENKLTEEEININNITLTNPFNKKKIKFIDIFDLQKKTVTINDIGSVLPRMNFKIYESLNPLIFLENEIEIDNFLLEIKYKIVLVLYSLYKIKYKLYETYINSINNLFNINNSQSKSSTDPNNTKTKTKKNTESDNTKTKKNTESNNIKMNEFNKKIKNIKNKIILLGNKNGILEQDEKILKYKEEIKKMIINKYNKKNLNIINRIN